MKHLNSKNILKGAIFLFAFVSYAHAQNKENVDQIIIIRDGDTIIHERKPSGFNLKKPVFEMDAWIKKFGQDTSFKKFKYRLPHFDELDNDSSSLSTDTTIRHFHKRMDGSNDRMRIFPPGDMSIRIPNAFREYGDVHKERPFPYFREVPNSQSFSYHNTDRNGILTRININISDVSDDQMKKITGVERIQNRLDVQDLTLFPNFSSGKMTLSFGLPVKGNTSIRILNSDYQQVYSDQQNVNTNYYKQFDLPKNGIYYISVKQEKSFFVKRIMKSN